MMKSVRLFNANTLFKVSLIMIVMVAAIYVIGFSECRTEAMRRVKTAP